MFQRMQWDSQQIQEKGLALWHRFRRGGMVFAARVRTFVIKAKHWFAHLTFRQWVWLLLGAAAAVTGLYFLLRARPEPPQLPVVSAEPI